MGEIFLGRQTGASSIDRLVVLKTLLPEFAEQLESIEAFLDEARVSATLNHPNIVTVYEVGKWSGTYFLAMEYIQGDSIGALISSVCQMDESVPLDVAAAIAHDAAIALDHAHVATDPAGEPLRIVHRDISPQNIMVRDDGVTKVVDFGIAKAANRATRTATGMVKGKCSYMSPEQILGGQIDARSDQFSLGTVLWEMCTAQRLFKSDSQFITFRKILEDPIVPPSEVVPEIPGKLDSVVMRMLARDPERRFARCAHVAEALDPFRSQAVSGAAQSVALFVKRVAGKKIKERTHDLTPSDESFFISLRDPPAGPLGSAVGPGREYGPTLPLWPTRKRRRWLGLASALVVAFLGGIGMWVARNATDEAAAQPPDAEAGEEIEAKPSAEEPAGPRGVLLLNSVPTGATVVAGTTVLGTTPVRIDVLAPRVEHQLQIERKGYEPGELRVRLKPGEIREETVMLKRTPRRRSINKARRSVDPPAAQPAFGSVSVDTTPWTQVSIDGLPLGSTPLHKVRLASGKHRLRFVNEQLGVDRSRDIVIRPGED